MKRYFQYIALACLAFALNSCIKDEFVDNSFCRDSQLTLNLSLGDLTRTEIPDNGIGEGTNDNGVVGDDKISLNENKITRVEIYLYPTGSESSDAKFAYAEDITANDKVEKLQCTVPAGALNDLFDSGTSCSAYVVVNYKNETVFDTDNAVKTLTGTSITTLKKRVVETDFTETTTIEVGWVPKKVIDPQDSFAMDSDIATITKTDNALSGTVYVTRAAAKITFTASIPVKLKVDGVEWTPQMEKLTVAFKNLATNSLVDNGSDTSDTTDDLNFPADNPAVYAGVSGIQLSYEAVDGDAPGFEGDSDVEGVDDGWLVANIVVPFYTYSNFWTEKADNEPAITLSVPWYVDGKESSTLTTYTYTVPFNIDATTKQGKFVRNKHYQYNLRVGVLGDLVELGTSEFSYVVLDWIGKNTIDVQLQKPTYLVVEKDYVEVFNENSYSVNYSSSDSIKAEIVSIIKPDYSERTPIEDYYIYGSETSTTGAGTVYGSSLKADSKGRKGNENEFTVQVDNSTITLEHILNNDLEDDGFDYIPYTVKVKVTMQVGTKTYIEYITFKQYPEMYISADLNSDYDNDNSVNGNRGYAWVNNSYTTLGDLDGFSTSNSNSNPNMITITTTALKRSDFLIGDPRSIDVNNLGYSQFVSAPSVQGNTRSLSYYYPTRSTDEAKSIISPKFRIASSYGLTSSISRTNAQYRCASYQEDGYPAGRWRIPTAAEIEYIVTLSARGFITILFNDGGNYWAANGYIYKPDYDDGGSVTQTTGNSAYVRCVYDEWYWGSEPIADKTKFTWGDEPR